ncbi:MAG: restriction endonuclease [bacterium]|nr:restriction endonuclease [bacterium]
MDQTQRRERRRRSAINQLSAFIIAAGLFAVGYLAARPVINDEMYRRVIASSGERTLSQVQVSALVEWALPLTVGYLLVALVLYLILNAGTSRRARFDFGKQMPAAPGGRPDPSDFKPDLGQISPREFERYIAWLIHQRTGYQTRVCGGAGDQGVDVEVFDGKDKLVGIVQCKRYDPSKALSPQYVRELATVRQMRGVQIAYLATTAYFTRDSHALAKRLGVRLIDGDDLRGMQS